VIPPRRLNSRGGNTAPDRMSPRTSRKRKTSVHPQEDLDAEHLYAAEIKDHQLLALPEELELARRLETTETTLWARLLEGPLSSEARQLFLERDAPLAPFSPEAARAADLDRGVIIPLVDHAQSHGDLALERELQILRKLSTQIDGLRARFVQCNLRLVPSTIRRYGYHHNTRLPMSDLIQEGNLGLIKAVPRFDYRRGHRFSTFAMWWIRHYLVIARQNLGAEVRIPLHLQDLASKVRQTKAQLRQKLQRDPSLNEISRKLEVSKKRIQALEGDWLRYPEALPSFDSTGEEGLMPSFLASTDPSADKVLASRQEAACIATAIESMPRLLAQIVRRRFGLDGGVSETLLQIGESLQLSRERIRQLEEKALGLLRRRLVEIAK